MTAANKSLDSLVNQWYPDIYRFCFLMSCHGEAAREITFQTFLYAGADHLFPEDKDQGRAVLFSYAAKTCEDYYLRRLRPRPSRKALEESVSFSVSDELWDFLKKPMKQKAISFLHSNLGFSLEQAGEIIKVSSSKTNKLFSQSPRLPDAEARAIIPDEETVSQISDDLYVRFEERNVKLENKLRGFRLSMDRAILWIALGILAFFAAAALYTASL